MGLEPGIYYNVPFNDYKAWDAVNNTLLWKIIDKSAMHAREYMLNPEDPTAAFTFGRGLHSFLLEPDKFFAEYAIAPKVDRRTKAGKVEFELFELENKGKELVKQEDYEIYRTIANRIKEQEINQFIRNGEAEVCLVWIDAKTGLKCKARLDYVHKKWGMIIDVKTTADASKTGFANSIANYGYYQQCAFYSNGWKQLTGEEAEFVFLACEKTPPYAIASYRMPEDIFYAGSQSYRRALNTYKECLENNYWPGYQETVETLDMPQWKYSQLGIGQFNIREVDNDETKDKSGYVTDWDQLGQDARDGEPHTES